MVGDAVVTAKHRGSDQSEQLLGLGAERAGLVGLVVQREEAFHAQVAAAENLLVQVSTKFLKIFQAIGHRSSRKSLDGNRFLRHYERIASSMSTRVSQREIKERSRGREGLFRGGLRSFCHGR